MHTHSSETDEWLIKHIIFTSIFFSLEFIEIVDVSFFYCPRKGKIIQTPSKLLSGKRFSRAHTVASSEKKSYSISCCLLLSLLLLLLAVMVPFIRWNASGKMFADRGKKSHLKLKETAHPMMFAGYAIVVILLFLSAWYIHTVFVFVHYYLHM